MPSTFLSMNQNGSNLVQVLLSIFSSYAENPGIFNFFKDSLLGNGRKWRRRVEGHLDRVALIILPQPEFHVWNDPSLSWSVLEKVMKCNS